MPGRGCPAAGVFISRSGTGEGSVASRREHHRASKHHRDRYVDEFDFRYNARDTTDGERAEPTLEGVKGKPLMDRY